MFLRAPKPTGSLPAEELSWRADLQSGFFSAGCFKMAAPYKHQEALGVLGVTPDTLSGTPEDSRSVDSCREQACC